MTNQIQLEPEAHAFAAATARAPLLVTPGLHQGRLALEEAQSGQAGKPAVDVEDLTITDGKSAQVGLRILRPQHTPTPLPVIVYIHGAGWVFGSPETQGRGARHGGALSGHDPRLRVVECPGAYRRSAWGDRLGDSLAA